MLQLRYRRPASGSTPGRQRSYASTTNSKTQSDYSKKRWIQEVDNFTYLGSFVSKDGQADKDIKSHVSKARHVFRTLTSIWRSSALSLHNKITIFNTNVKSVMLYSSETWHTTKTSRNKLQMFINWCLLNILNIRGPKSSQTKNFGKGQNKPQLKKTSRRGNWGGLATRCTNLHQMLSDRHWTGTAKESWYSVGPGRLGEEARMVK